MGKVKEVKDAKGPWFETEWKQHYCFEVYKVNVSILLLYYQAAIREESILNRTRGPTLVL